MATIVVLGAGRMGGAICVPLADQGHRIRLVGSPRDEAIVDALAVSGIHPGLGVPLTASVAPVSHTELPEAMASDVDLVIVAVALSGLPWAVDQLARAPAWPVPVMLVTRGLHAAEGDILSLPRMVERRLAERGRPAARIGTISGPCRAAELAARRDVIAMVAYPDATGAALIAGLLNAPYYHVRASTDVTGVAAATALGGLLALGVASTLGRSERDGAATEGAQSCAAAGALFSQALAELATLVGALGGRGETAYGPAGAGRLHIAAQAGADASLGRALGRGETFRAPHVGVVGGLCEAAELALAVGPTLASWCVTGRLDPAAVPLVRALIDAICHEQALVLPWARLHRRVEAAPGGAGWHARPRASA